MNESTIKNVVIIIKKIHKSFKKIFDVLNDLDDAYNKKDCYVTQYKTYLTDYIKTMDDTILSWHNSLIIIESRLNKYFELKMFEKINGCFYYDDVMRVRYKSDICYSVKEVKDLIYDLNSILLVYTNISFAY